jgi:hypothetical protein
MTRKEAEAIIIRIARFDIPLSRPAHFWERAGARRFTLADVTAVLRSHITEHAPEWNEGHGSYRVSLRGRCLDGRPTRVILDLRADGPCTLVTIMVARKSGRRRR